LVCLSVVDVGVMVPIILFVIDCSSGPPLCYFKEQYKRIYEYAHELLKCNPGSNIKIKVENDTDEAIFQRFYSCLKACKYFFVFCRPIKGLDGCFLKGKYGGELLSVVGRDANDQLLLLAYAVVEVENKETWTWFLELLIGEDFIPICFRRSIYEEIYQYIIFPVNGEVLWEKTPYPDVHPPHKRILPGRPKKKRRLEEWELRKDNTQISKVGHRKKM